MRTSLQLGNEAFRRADYLQAIACYASSLGQTPEMASFTLANLELARRRLRAGEGPSQRPRVLVASTELGLHADRLAVVARCHGPDAALTVLGAGQPPAGFPWPVHALDAVGKGSAQQALEAIARQPVDLLHLVGVGEGTLLLAIAARALWRCPVLVDVGAGPLPEGPAWSSMDAVTRTSVTAAANIGTLALPEQAAAMLEQVRDWLGEPPRAMPASWITVVKQQPTGPGANALRALSGLGQGSVTGRDTLGVPPRPANVAPAAVASPKPDTEIAPPAATPATAARGTAKPSPAAALPSPVLPSRPRTEAEPALPRANGQSINFCGVAIARLPTQATLDDSALAAPATLAALLADDPAAALASGRQPMAGAPGPQPMRTRLVGTGRSIADIGHLDERTLRWRLEAEAPDGEVPPCQLTFLQMGPDGQVPVALARARCEGPGPHIVDVRLRHAMFPVLLVATDAQDGWLDASLLPFPSLCRGGMHHAELWISGSAPASMAELQATSNVLVHELLGGPLFEGPLALEALKIDLAGATGAESVFQAPVRQWLAGVMGMPMPSPQPGQAGDLLEPVSQHLHSACSDARGVEASPGGQRLARSRSGGLSLYLPADAVPTLSLLASRRLVLGPGQAGAVGTYAMAHFATGRPHTLVSLPPLEASLLALQPAGAPLAWPMLRPSAADSTLPSEGPMGRCELPLAVRLTERVGATAARALAPVPTDLAGPLFRSTAVESRGPASRVTVVLDGEDLRRASVTRLLASLQAQTVSEAIELAVAIPGSLPQAQQQALRSELQAHWPVARLRLVDTADARRSARLNEAARAAQGFVLFMEAATFLHDTRTVETLRRVASHPGTASASCLLVREVPAKKGTDITYVSGGLFPGHLSFTGRVSLTLEETVTSHAFPLATYPVLGNTFRLAMVPAHVWRDMTGLDEARFPMQHADVDFCLRAAGHGLRHLCTSVVTATSFSAPVGTVYSDTHSLRLLPLERWHEVLARSTALRDLDA